MSDGHAGSTDERADELRTIASRVSEGTYRVEALSVADAILRAWRMDDLTGAFSDQSNTGSGTSSSRD